MKKKRTLYETLGVEKTADADEIKKAFRRKAKALHPDKRPGDKMAKDEMAALSNARAILISPERRARYDETGDEETGPDVTQSTAIGFITSLLSQLLMAEPETPDFRAAIISALQRNRREVDAKAAPFRRAITRAERTKTRWARKTKEKPNEIGRILEWQVDQQKTILGKIDADLKALDRAIEIMNDYSYEAEIRQTVVFGTSSTSTVYFR